MFSPCTTGVVVKLKVIVALPLLNVNEVGRSSVNREIGCFDSRRNHRIA